MKSRFLFMVCCAAVIILFTPSYIAAEQSETKKPLDLETLQIVPSGNYVVTLEVNGKPVRMNFTIENNRGKCVDSSDPGFKAVQAQFQPYARQPGAFVARLRGGEFMATQLWIFRTDGIAAIRETPDRGEIQSAVPVRGPEAERVK